MTGHRCLWAVLFVCLLSGFAQAQAQTPALEPLDELALHPQWLTLVHYRPARGDNQWRGSADDPNFYLAETGKTDPKAELVATLAAFSQTDAEKAIDAHPLCRFPARAFWLRQQLPQANIPVVECPAFQDWRKDVPSAQLVLVFPAAYLNSPSSMFGHTLLRLDSPETETQSALLSHALDFAAWVDNSDNQVVFAWRGMTGGYPGYFSLLPYHRKVRAYNALENRDIWEYPLAYTPEEIDFLLLHVWELDKIRFDYYFTSQNCSYQLLALLDILRPEAPLSWEFGITTIPVDTVRALYDAELISSAHYRPSKTTEFRQTLAQISEPNQALVSRLVYSRDFDKHMATATQLDSDEQAMVYLAAYRLTRLAAQRKIGDAELRRRSHRLLLARSAIDARTEFAFVEPPRAELGHASRRVQLSAGVYDDQTYLSMALRPAFHHLTDNIAGYSPGAQINFLDTQINVWEDQGLRLERVDVFDIRSLSPRDRYLKPWSWQVRTGVERFFEGEDQQPLYPHLQAAFGHTYRLGDQGLWFVMPGLTVQHQRKLPREWQLAPMLQVGVAWQTKHLNILLQAEQQWFLDMDQDRRQLGLTVNRPLSANHSLSLDLHYQRGLSGYESQGGAVAWRYFF